MKSHFLKPEFGEYIHACVHVCTHTCGTAAFTGAVECREMQVSPLFGQFPAAEWFPRFGHFLGCHGILGGKGGWARHLPGPAPGPPMQPCISSLHHRQGGMLICSPEGAAELRGRSHTCKSQVGRQRHQGPTRVLSHGEAHVPSLTLRSQLETISYSFAPPDIKCT